MNDWAYSTRGKLLFAYHIKDEHTYSSWWLTVLHLYERLNWKKAKTKQESNKAEKEGRKKGNSEGIYIICKEDFSDSKNC